MAVITLGGIGNQQVGFDAKFPEPRNIRVLTDEYGSLTAMAEVFGEGRWQDFVIDYEYNDFFVSRANARSVNGIYTLDIKGILWDFDQIDSLNGFELEDILLDQDTLFIGSEDGGSVRARLLDGNDYARLNSGNKNFLNGNNGLDTIVIYGGGGKALGGADDDTITVFDGNYSSINGNRGNDLIANYAASQAMIRGGSEDDTIVSRGGSMNAYGDLGADTFTPFSTGYMVVKDYQSGVDRVDLSNLFGYTTSQESQGLVVRNSLGSDVMLLQGVSSL